MRTLFLPEVNRPGPQPTVSPSVGTLHPLGARVHHIGEVDEVTTGPEVPFQLANRALD